MAYSTPLTAVSNATLTAAQWNASVRDNLSETAPAKATTAGGLFVGTGANAIAERLPSVANVLTQETTTSTSFTDLATFGPQITVTSGVGAIVIISCHMFNSTGGAFSRMGYEVSGASSEAAATSSALVFAGTLSTSASYVVYMSSLTAGSNTFTAKYSVSTGTGTFANRRLSVIPL